MSAFLLYKTFFAFRCVNQTVSDFSERCFEISKQEFFDEWIKYNKNDRVAKLSDYLSKKFNLSNLSQRSLAKLNNSVKLFSLKMLQKWNESSRKQEVFLRNNEQWLSTGCFIFKVEHFHDEFDEPQPSTSTGAGRPKLEFEDASVKTKRRRLHELLGSHATSELTFAAEMSVRASGQRDAANLIKEVTTTSPKRATRIKQTRTIECIRRPLSSDEALAYYVDSKSTSHSYKTTRKWMRKTGHLVLPSYYALQKSKLACIPNKQFLSVTDIRAEIDLQAILNLTAARLVTVQSEVLKSLSPITEYTLISKWGCDGSSGRSRYKQKFAYQDSDDEYLFVYSFVPIKLYKLDENEQCIWQNPRPASTMYCRPIKFIFLKEDDKTTKRETNIIKNQIKNLQFSKIKLEDKEIVINHKLLFTMVDGKVCNAMTETKSTQMCYICKATPKFMNQPNPKLIDSETNYGLVYPLHA